MALIYNFFIPHHGNDHRAIILKPAVMSFFTLVFICSQIFLNFFLLATPKVLGYSADISPERIVELTNQERATSGLPPLKLNSLLSEAAQRKAGDIFAFNYWAHVSPSGRDPWTFFKEVDYHYLHAGENLARDFRDPESVVKAWMNSPSHRDNIVNEKYQEIGVAVVDGTLKGVETTLVVQLFGSPQGQAVANVDRGTVPREVIAQEPAKISLLPGQAGGLSASSGKETSLSEVNPFSITKIIGIFLVGVIVGAFFFDFFFVSDRKTPRLSSRSFAQLLFLGFILLMVLVSKQGAIL